MIKIAIVDDERSAISDLHALINRFGENEKIEFAVDTYQNPIDFIEE